jgi:uncharacterized protein HemY
MKNQTLAELRKAKLKAEALYAEYESEAIEALQEQSKFQDAADSAYWRNIKAKNNGEKVLNKIEHLDMAIAKAEGVK